MHADVVKVRRRRVREPAGSEARRQRHSRSKCIKWRQRRRRCERGTKCPVWM
jgi:hypothetical protein